jgi:hypothetical protein
VSDNAVSRRLRRVFSMSGDEFVTRSRQEVGKRIDGVLARGGHDFSEAPRATSVRPKFFFDAEDVPAILSLLKQRLPAEYDRIIPRAERICAHRFDLLGYRDLDYGKEIDWSLDRVHGTRAPRKLFYKLQYLDFQECGDVKVTWELNRHQHFLTLAKAFRITGDPRFADELFAQWGYWHRENPYPYGVNWASSLEFAFRSLSWFWTYYLLGESAQQRPGFREQFLRSISVHGRAIERYLSTYFSPNTHLLGEAVALFFIGVLCPELPSSERWKKLGWNVVLQEAQRQVRPDGLHFEQSLYYHVYAVDFFLHARLLAARNGFEIPVDHDATIERMLSALAVLGRAGTVPRIGDDDGGRLFDGQRNRPEHMLDPLATGAVLYQRGDFKALAGGFREETLWLLGIESARTFDSIAEQTPKSDSISFPDSGLYVINAPDSQIVIDAGPLGAGSGGHGHADALSIYVTDKSGPVLIDGGTFEYVGDGHERNQYRSTAAHNTLTVDGVSQPESRGPFAWSHHPKSTTEKWINGTHFDLFIGSHDTYAPVTHRRFLFSRKSDFWFVRDVVEGSGEHNLEAYWHIAPEFTVSEGRFSRSNRDVLDVVSTADNRWRQTIGNGTWSPAYGEAQPAPVLYFSTVASLPTEFVTLFRSRENASVRPGTLKTVGESSSVRAYVYAERDEEHRFFFATASQDWAADGWSSDAEFVYWGYDRRQDRGLLILVGGTKIICAGQAIAECSKRAAFCEVLWESGHAQMMGTEDNRITVHDSAFRSLMAEPVLSASPRQKASE